MHLLVIPTYNRPIYLQKTLESLAKAVIDQPNVLVWVTDDGSTDPRVEHLCRQFAQYHLLTYFQTGTNIGVAGNLLRGIEEVLANMSRPPESIVTLDSDFMVKPQFLCSLWDLLAQEGSPDTIITGFNATSHPIITQRDGYAVKQSIGGGNLCCTLEAYKRHIKPNLVDAMWDWRMCSTIQRVHGKLICITPSICQHIGMVSVMNHPQADVAMDFTL
ncbi:MAG: glycosyltransferase family 2 protein [Parcubacteria group bacterium]|jgi:glycosyltransferase involved in cell wall biosynthesis